MDNPVWIYWFCALDGKLQQYYIEGTFEAGEPDGWTTPGVPDKIHIHEISLVDDLVAEPLLKYTEYEFEQLHGAETLARIRKEMLHYYHLEQTKIEEGRY